jgi:hypothetical protein
LIKPLNAELNPICHLLALLRAHPILHVSRIRVKLRRRDISDNLVISYVMYIIPNIYILAAHSEFRIYFNPNGIYALVLRVPVEMIV